MKRTNQCLIAALLAAPAWASADALSDAVASINPQVVEWRRDIHANPELGNREFRTAALVAEHLASLGLEVSTGIAHTGVVAVLEGGQPGPTVALRADMDALPVTEQVDLPFASTVTSEYRGQTVGVMHACGHDNHVAILMGAAELLTGMKDQLAGRVVFIFQPAEEGPPDGEDGGAGMMLSEGLFDRHDPDVIFGLHVGSALNVGHAGYRSGPMMASADTFRIDVTGKQTHASRPWNGVDPIVTASQIVMGLQTIASRQVDVTLAPSVISIGSISGGIRHNIIPDAVEMWGTIRAFDEDMRAQIHTAIDRSVTLIAEAAGARAQFEITYGIPVTVNDPMLTEQMLPTLRAVLGADKVHEVPLITGAEDFSYFAQQVPGFYFFLGGTPVGQDAAKAPSNHSPLFFADESVLPLGVELMTRLTLDYLASENG